MDAFFLCVYKICKIYFIDAILYEKLLFYLLNNVQAVYVVLSDY